jgi:hypothetical protein
MVSRHNQWTIGEEAEIQIGGSAKQWVLGQITEVFFPASVVVQYEHDGKTLRKELDADSPLLAKRGYHLVHSWEVDEEVEVKRSTNKEWVSAKVTAVLPSSIRVDYLVDGEIVHKEIPDYSPYLAKKGTHLHPEKNAYWTVDEVVEVKRSSNGQWIVAKVVEVLQDSVFVEYEVDGELLKKVLPYDSPNLAKRGTHVVSNGRKWMVDEEMEVKRSTNNEWVHAKVILLLDDSIKVEYWVDGQVVHKDIPDNSPYLAKKGTNISRWTVGEVVEIQRTSNKQWVYARITDVVPPSSVILEYRIDGEIFYKEVEDNSPVLAKKGTNLQTDVPNFEEDHRSPKLEKKTESLEVDSGYEKIVGSEKNAKEKRAKPKPRKSLNSTEPALPLPHNEVQSSKSGRRSPRASLVTVNDEKSERSSPARKSAHEDGPPSLSLDDESSGKQSKRRSPRASLKNDPGYDCAADELDSQDRRPKPVKKK